MLDKGIIIFGILALLLFIIVNVRKYLGSRFK